MLKLTVYIFLTSVLLLANTSFSSTKETFGVAVVVDGDTIKLKGVSKRIRLYGIDAPEKNQTCTNLDNKSYSCGLEAKEALTSVISKTKKVKCIEMDQDRYGRMVAECYTDQDVNLNSWMVREGWAIEYRQYSDGRYTADETEAKGNKLGL